VGGITYLPVLETVGNLVLIDPGVGLKTPRGPEAGVGL